MAVVDGSVPSATSPASGARLLRFARRVWRYVRENDLSGLEGAQL